MTIVEIARVAHNVYKTYCDNLNIQGHLSWKDSSGEQRERSIFIMACLLEEPSIIKTSLYCDWLKHKATSEKEAKDYIFSAVANSLSTYSHPPVEERQLELDL